MRVVAARAVRVVVEPPVESDLGAGRAGDLSVGVVASFPEDAGRRLDVLGEALAAVAAHAVLDRVETRQQGSEGGRRGGRARDGTPGGEAALTESAQVERVGKARSVDVISPQAVNDD